MIVKLSPDVVAAIRAAPPIADYPGLLLALVNAHAVPKALAAAGWTFAVSRGRRGYCYSRRKLITIPKHALTSNKGPGYDVYYIHHECAHAAGIRNHGPAFMVELKRICPPDVIHYELGYKPRNARAAGIAENNC